MPTSLPKPLKKKDKRPTKDQRQKPTNPFFVKLKASNCQSTSPSMSHRPSRLSVSTVAKNTKLTKDILNGTIAIFARIEANIGPTFRIVVYNSETEKSYTAFASPRGIFRRKKGVMEFKADDIVVISTIPQPNQLCEIIGLLTCEEASILHTDGRIPSIVYYKPDANPDINAFIL
jgi:hypothetical protein